VAFSRKKRFEWRGNDRGYLRLLQKGLLLMAKRDQRMLQREENLNETAFYFDPGISLAINDAMQLLTNRIDECLAAKA